MTALYYINGYPLTPSQYEYVVKRPDLPPCERCGSGTKCSCEVHGGAGPCGCMGFTGCPDCHRGELPEGISLANQLKTQ